MKKRYATLFCFTIIVFNNLISCNQRKSDTKDKKNENIVWLKKDTIPINASLIGAKLFSLPIDSFFKDSEIVRILNSDDKAFQSRFYVPLALFVKENNVFIPNRKKRRINIYNFQGEKIGLIRTDSLQPDYFENLNDDSFVINDLGKHKLSEIQNNQIKQVYESSYLKFSSSNNNYIFKKGINFYDKAKSFNGNIEFLFLGNSFDYKLINNTLTLAYVDKNLKFEVYNNDQLSSREIINQNIDWDNIYGIKILSYDKQEIKLLLTTDNIGEAKIMTYNVKSKQSKLLNLNLSDKIDTLIGEGATLWSDGGIYFFDPKTNIIFLMTTDTKNISLYEYKLK